MLPIIKKIIPAVALLFATTCALAQQNTHFLSGSISENSLVELRLVQVVNNKTRPVGEYYVHPGKTDFAFAIPPDTGVTYRLHVNIMKKEGRHAKLDKTYTLPLKLNPEENYTLKITPSRLHVEKKTGWSLKQDISQSNIALISGKVVGLPIRSGMQISLQNVENGALVLRNSVQSNSDGLFAISFPVRQEGFYYLSSPRWQVRVYLKPADRLQVDIDHKTGCPVDLNGSPENQVVYQWHQLILPITSYGYNLALVSTDAIDMNEYILMTEKLQPAMDDFFKNMDKSNPQFVKMFKHAMDIDRQLPPIDFLLHKSAKKVTGFKPRPKDFNEVPAFYKQFIQPGKFGNASILLVGEAMKFMQLYARLNLALLPEKERQQLSQADQLKLMMNTISNDTLKSIFFNDQMNQIEVNNLSEFRETFEPFKKYAENSPAKETYKNIYGTFSHDTTFIGKSSYDFSLPDTSGKMVSMKDFKGKVVFIDVWATWCGPCKAQFPFLREIEHEYADNKDLVFVGISTDKAEVKQKWAEMIRKENLGGIQLLDDWGKAFGRKYEITAIPRFMLIDRQGNWIEIRCPKPEAKEALKRYLEKALRES